MKSKIIITGHGGSGKDYLMKKLILRGLKPTLSVTTRPIRDGEVNGIDYKFVDYITFQRMILQKQFMQWKVFLIGNNDKDSWYYGTTKESWENDDVFIMTPPGIADIPKEDREKCVVIYLNIDESIRRERLQKRRDADSVSRRIDADKEMFANFTDYDIIINNPDF